MAKTRPRPRRTRPKATPKAVEYLQKHNVDLVVLESTGGLEVPLANALHAADIRVVIANPQRTHQYAASFSLGKTDHLDAKMLADYAQALDSRKMADDMRWVKDDNPSSAINNKPELTANGKSAAQNRWIAYNKMRGITAVPWSMRCRSSSGWTRPVQAHR